MEELERSLTGSKEPAITRRTFLKTGLKWGAALAGMAAGGAGYTLKVEPRWLETVHNPIKLAELPEPFRGTKLVHVSDIHIGFHYGMGELERLVDRIMQEEPDLICFTGDLVESSTEGQGKEIARVLSRLKAPLGQFAVFGNHDYLIEPKEVERTLAGGGFQVLRDKSILLEKDGARLRLTGLEGWVTFARSMDKVLAQSVSGECTIVLAHMPDLAVSVKSYPVALQLSGHSHGGQVRLPGYGPLTKVRGAAFFDDGLVSLERDGGGTLQLYTTRGIGMTKLPIRFWCRPELSVHTLL